MGRRKESRAEPTAVTGRQDPSPTMMEEGQEGCGVRTEERIPASGVVWKEAPESAIHSVLTGGVRPMALKDCASAAWSHLYSTDTDTDTRIGIRKIRIHGYGIFPKNPIRGYVYYLKNKIIILQV